MKTDLERLLRELDPERTIEPAFRRADEAINSFPMQWAQIAEWDRFRDCMVRFVALVESYVLRLRRPVRSPIDFEWDRATAILVKIYGRNGEKAAFEMARTGNEGGLYGVLKAVAMRLAEDISKNEIASRVSAFWQNHTPAEVLSASQEYLDKYGHLLASELTEGSAGRLRANFLKVLENHPEFIQRLRRVGR